MTATTKVIENSLRQYILAHSVREDKYLQDLRKAAIEEGLPEIHIAPEQGALMRILVRINGARNMIEVGTLGGYSALWLAGGLPEDGQLMTIEINNKHADFAEKWIAGSDYAQKVKVIRGRAADRLVEMEDNSADAAFMDADKESYEEYLDQFSRIIRPGGLLMVDNAFAFGNILDEAVQTAGVLHLRRFNEILSAHDDFESTIMTVGDGLWVSVRR